MEVSGSIALRGDKVTHNIGLTKRQTDPSSVDGLRANTGSANESERSNFAHQWTSAARSVESVFGICTQYYKTHSRTTVVGIGIMTTEPGGSDILEFLHVY